MKTIILCLALLMACFPILAQTNLNRGLLVVYQDLNDNPYQFAGNQNVQHIVIKPPTRTLPGEVFAGTRVLDVIFEEPSRIEVIPIGAFSESLYLHTVKLPESSLKIIEESAFFGCSALSQITLPPGLEEIQDFAFYYTSLSHLYIPDSVKIIGAGILDEIRDLESVRLPANADIHYYHNDFYPLYEQNGKKAGIYVRVRVTDEVEVWEYRQDQSEADYYLSGN